MEEIAKNEYYSIGVDKGKNRIYIVMTDFWGDVSLAASYVEDIRTACQMVSKDFTVLADLRNMKTPSVDVKQKFAEVQNIMEKAGLLKTAEILPEDVVAQMSVDRTFKKYTMVRGLFSSKLKAEAWLDGQSRVRDRATGTWSQI